MATPTYPKKRGLTSGEIEMLKNVYGDSINYDEIKIKSGYVKKGSEAYVPTKNTIVFSDKGSSRSLDYSDSKESKGNKQVFIHEMGHIWQRQSGVNLTTKKYLLNRSGIKDQYAYTLSDEKKLDDYSVEQQPEIISDYYMLKYENWKYYKSSPPMSKKDLLKKYENVLDEFQKNPDYLKKRLKDKYNDSDNLDSVSTGLKKRFVETGVNSENKKHTPENSSLKPSMKNPIFPQKVWERLGFTTEGNGEVITGRDSNGKTKQYIGYSVDSVKATSSAKEPDPTKAGQNYISDRYHEHKISSVKENTPQSGIDFS